MKLLIELIPSTSFFSNVRALVTKKEWEQIRIKCYSLANDHCEICGRGGSLECHEEWEYIQSDIDKTKGIQKLTKLVGICSFCHKSKHIGFARIKGWEEMCIRHLMKVNNMDRKVVQSYIDDCFKLWKDRSQIEWKLDIKYLDNYLK